MHPNPASSTNASPLAFVTTVPSTDLMLIDGACRDRDWTIRRKQINQSIGPMVEP